MITDLWTSVRKNDWNCQKQCILKKVKKVVYQHLQWMVVELGGVSTGLASLKSTVENVYEI